MTRAPVRRFGLLSARRQPQIKGHRKERVDLFLRRRHRAERREGHLEALHAPAFSFRSVDWTSSVRTAVGWSNMVSALANRAAPQAVDKVEDKGRMNGNCRVQ
jgi:hypothetical protein